MTKTITAERIKQSLAKVQEVRSRKCKHNMDLIGMFATHGLKSIVGAATESDKDRIDLELSYREAPKDELSLKLMMDTTFYQIRRYEAKTDRIYGIQERYEVSGLVTQTVTLGQRSIECLVEDDELRLIESDLPKMYTSLYRQANMWLDYVKVDLDYPIYLRDKTVDGWREVSINRFLAELQFYQWAYVWEEAHYTSPSLMQSQGWDSLRSKPERDDDELNREVHITIGRGTDTSSSEQSSLWFCGSNRVPSL